MYAIEVSRPDVRTDEGVVAVLRDGLGPSYNVLPGMRQTRAPFSERAWLLGQLKGICTALRWQQGHGAVVEVAPETDFALAQRLLDDALPETGEVARRYHAWESAYTVARDVCAQPSIGCRQRWAADRGSASGCPTTRQSCGNW